jgi:ABC-2 type transport system permease protein
MNAIMLRRALTDYRRTTLWYVLGTAIYVILIGLFYPSVRDSSEDFDELLKSYPDALLRAFGLSADATLSAYSVYVSAETLSFIWPIIASAFVIMTAGALVAQEIERGTVEYWLSVPEERWRLLLSKYLGLLVMIVIFVFITVAVVGIMGVAMGGDVTPGGLLAVFVTMLLFAVTVASYTALLSAISDNRSRAAGLAAAITTGMYLLNVVSQLGADWRWLRFFSIFTAYQPQDALQRGEIAPVAVTALLAIIAACLVGTLVTFQRRDIVL